MTDLESTDRDAAAVTSQLFEVNHIRIHAKRQFDDVRKMLESILKRLTEKPAEAFGRCDVAAARKELERIGSPSGLSILYQLDHGVALQLRGQDRQAIQYGIGNVLTATEMSQHHLGAALYAPLRVLVYGVADGTVIEFDQPLTQFAVFGNKDIKEVGLRLDRQLMAVVRYVTGETDVEPRADVV